MKIKFLTTLCCLLFISGFTQKAKIDEPPIKVTNFKTLPAPTTAFPPGYVFRIPKNSKEQIPVTIVGAPADYLPKDYSLPDIVAKWKTNIFVNFIFAKILGFTGKRNSEKLIVASFTGGKIEQLFDDKIDDLLKAAAINFKKNSDYYVINQTLSFDSIGYKVHDYNSFDVDAKNYIDTMKVKANININTVAGDTTKFNQRFDKPHRVFYTIIKVTAKGTQISGGRKFDFSPSQIVLSDEQLLKETN